MPAAISDIAILMALEMPHSFHENCPEMAELMAVIRSDIPWLSSVAVSTPAVPMVATTAAAICTRPIRATAHIESHGLGFFSSRVKKYERPSSRTSERACSRCYWAAFWSKRASTSVCWVIFTWFLFSCADLITLMAASMCLSC